MKISCITAPISFNGIKRFSLAAKLCPRKSAQPQKDEFKLSVDSHSDDFVKNIFSGIRKFNIDDYNSLSVRDKLILRNTLKKKSRGVHYAMKENIDVALKLKSHLDEKYGEGSYVFVSIGTSPASLGRVFEFSGVETKYLPISDLRNITYYDNFENRDVDFKSYGKFLKEQGLTLSEIKKSGKQYLFFDYTSTGTTLKLFSQLMKDKYNLYSPNIKYKSLNQELEDTAYLNDEKPNGCTHEYINYYLNASHSALYGGVPHLPVTDFDKVSQCKEYQNYCAKAYNFFVIDELNKRGLLKYNPKNSNSL